MVTDWGFFIISILLPLLFCFLPLINWHNLFISFYVEVIINLQNVSIMVSRIEKIAFITSFWNIFRVKGNLDFCSNEQLDRIIDGIMSRVQALKEINAIIHVQSMPVFLN